MKYIGTALFALILSACSSSEINNAQPEEKENNQYVSSKSDILNNEESISLSHFNDTTFILDSIDQYKSKDYDNINVVFTRTKNLGDIVRGDSGCNRFFAKYETIRSLLVTSEIVATENRCSRSQAELENFIFKIFSQRPVVSFQNDSMIFETPSNKLIFRKK